MSRASEGACSAGGRPTAGYEFREDIAIADVAFRAWGERREEVFLQAARATLNVMVAELGSIAGRLTRPVGLQAESLELLLFDFLNEFLFFKDAEQLLLLPAAIEIREVQSGFALQALLRGEPLDPARHPLLVDVKAVTMYRFSLKWEDGSWRAEVVLDI